MNNSTVFVTAVNSQEDGKLRQTVNNDGERHMRRGGYKIFSEGKIGNLVLPNRLVRSATWDPSILGTRKMTDEVLDLYRALAVGGVGLIITGGLPVYASRPPDEKSGKSVKTFDDLHVQGIEQLAEVVHRSRSGCKIVAQLETGYVNAVPSVIPSPFAGAEDRQLDVAKIRSIADCFVQAIVRMRESGFDGVQLHAAHGGLLSRFLSPYTNRRTDAYGGSTANRVRLVREIVARARKHVGGWPILIKVNCTDYLEGGTEIGTFPALAEELQAAGLDAIEISGGMWECLARPAVELGFRPVPAPESHTRIARPEKQSYFLRYAKKLRLEIPVILVGGNRNVERLEEIVRQGKVDFVALCRPLIREPDLPQRWLEGRGGKTTRCISCNSCLYNMYVHPGQAEPGVVTCLAKQDPAQHRAAQAWLAQWVEENVPRDPERQP